MPDAQPDSPVEFEPSITSEVALDDVDLRIIQEQLEHQKAETEEERINFTAAYLEAKKLAFTSDLSALTAEDAEDLILTYAKTIYPRENQFGLKSFQTIHNETKEPIGEPPGQGLVNRITRWCKWFAAAELPAEQLFYEFEDTHPFHDGNGRVGHLMWAIDIMRRTGEWPQALPPDYNDLKAIYGKTLDASDFSFEQIENNQTP